MKLLRIAVVAVVALSFVPAEAQQCSLQFISHGTFREVDGCRLFEDDLGTLWEVVKPRGSWKDGTKGTIYAEWAETGACSGLPALKACRFEADYTRKVSGTLVFRTLIECPGYIVDGANQDYLILNCEDFGDELCAPENLGRHVQTEVYVDTGLSICLGLARSTVFDFRFAP